MIVLALCAAFPLATSVAYAQSAATPAPAPQAAPKSQPQGGVTPITTIDIVDLSELPAQTKDQVNAALAKRSDADVQKLRSSIDKSPQVTAALKEKGLTSAAVVIASLDSKGLLTLVTKKAG
jgi:hypothetical protein